MKNHIKHTLLACYAALGACTAEPLTDEQWEGIDRDAEFSQDFGQAITAGIIEATDSNKLKAYTDRGIDLNELVDDSYNYLYDTIERRNIYGYHPNDRPNHKDAGAFNPDLNNKIFINLDAHPNIAEGKISPFLGRDGLHEAVHQWYGHDKKMKQKIDEDGSGVGYLPYAHPFIDDTLLDGDPAYLFSAAGALQDRMNLDIFYNTVDAELVTPDNVQEAYVSLEYRMTMSKTDWITNTIIEARNVGIDYNDIFGIPDEKLTEIIGESGVYEYQNELLRETMAELRKEFRQEIGIEVDQHLSEASRSPMRR